MSETDNHPPTEAPAPRQRLVWAFYGGKSGDNDQVAALAQGLGIPFEEKRLSYNALYSLPNRILGASLRSVDPAVREQLHAPWPDLVIGAGRRWVPAARWIKHRAGGQTKIVQIGRPRAPLALFDLVITTRQYALPKAPNVLSLNLPLSTEPDNGEDAAEDWRGVFAELPEPRVGVLVGGSRWPFVFDRAAAAKMAGDLNGWAARFGGSALIATSPRSGRGAVERLSQDLELPHQLHRWKPGAPNPYRAILRLADRLIVTSDSVSMLADACRAGLPTALWDTPRRRDPFSRACLALADQADRGTLTGSLMRTLAASGIFSPPRNVARISAAVVEGGHACWFNRDRDIPAPRQKYAGSDDLRHATAEVQTLLRQ